MWTVTYVVTWVSRWLITAVFLGWDHTMDVVTNIAKFRIDGDFGTVSHTFGAAVLKNGRTWLAVPVMPEVVLVAALVAVWSPWSSPGAASAPAGWWSPPSSRRRH